MSDTAPVTLPESKSQKKTYRIGTRASKLAMWQAEFVKTKMEKANPDLSFEIVAMTTTGDNVLNVPLSQFENKGIFTKELDIALLNHQVDAVVHCVKDLPTILPPGIIFSAIMDREAPEDCVLLHPKYRQQYQDYLKKESETYGTTIPLDASRSFDLDLPELTGDAQKPKLCPALSFLPNGAIIGTSALRRQATLARYHPHLVCKDIRGNVGTRINKLDSGDYDAIILAKIGLERLGLDDRVDAVLNSDHYLHAVGQAALAVVCNEDDDDSKNLFMASLHNVQSALSCTIERAMLNALQGGCKVPIACATKCFIVPNSAAITHLHSIETYRALTRSVFAEQAAQADADIEKHPIETSLIPQHLYDGLPSLVKFTPETDLRDIILTQSRLVRQEDSDNECDADDAEETHSTEETFSLPTVFNGEVVAPAAPVPLSIDPKRPVKKPSVPLTPRTRAQTWSLLLVTRAAVLSMNGQNYIETLVGAHFPLYLKSQFSDPISSKAWSIGMDLGFELTHLGADRVLNHIRSQEHEEVTEQKSQ